MPDSDSTSVTAKPYNSYPFWALRFWSGMRVRSFWRLMGRHGFRVHPARYGMVAILAQMTPFNSAFYRWQQFRLGSKIEATRIDPPPIFIIGHWRTGTTHLHELLIRDERFGFPTTFECFAPYHFLVTEWFLRRLLSFGVPNKRPMDNVATGFDRPQEDEFGLVCMGAPSMYYRMAFPNNPPVDMETLTMEDVSEDVERRLEEAIFYFLKAMTFRKEKRLVLKSPTHTGRLAWLGKRFPGAKFVHITRHPYAIFPSMKRTWAALDEAQAFQRRAPDAGGIDEFILSTFERMFDGYDRQRDQIPPEDLCEIRYEDLVQDPVGQVQAIYESLHLGEFDRTRPALEEYVASLKDYQANRLQVDPEIKRQIDRRWSTYMERYGYQDV